MKMRDSKPITAPADHDGRAFKPAKYVREDISKAKHPHMQDTTHVKKNFRGEDGTPVTAPRNFVTSAIKTGNCAQKGATFGGMADHKSDDFFAAKKNAKKDLDSHLEAIAKVADKPFSQRTRMINQGSVNQGYFTKFTPHIDLTKCPNKVAKAKGPNPIDTVHDGKAFKPSQPPKSGVTQKGLSAFPKYMENPTKSLTKKVAVEGDEAPIAWKKTHNAKTRATPSVQTNIRNLKASFPSVFKR